MKILFILLICITTGCSLVKDDNYYKDYYQAKEQLISNKNYNQPTHFECRLVYNKIKKQYRYDLFVEKPKIDMYNIKTICYTNNSIDTEYPSIGYFESEKYHLVNNYVDKSNGFYKGIHLSGLSNNVSTIYLLISYNKEINSKKIYTEFIEVHP